MKHIFTSVVFLSAFILSSTAQNPFTFTNANAKFVSAAFHSGNSVSVVDMDGDGMDDIARLGQSNDLYYTIQRTNQTFNNIHAGSTGSSSAWAMAVGDVDKDGVRDVAVGFGSSAKLVKPNSTLTSFPQTTFTAPSGQFFPQNMNFADINNDGWADMFICNDNAVSAMWGNNGAGAYGNPTHFFNAGNPNSDSSGNYGSIWTDIDNDGDVDLYIAHCRQGTNAGDARRMDQLFINDGAGHYVLDAANARGLRNAAMTWTSSFEDIDNDGDLDCILTETDKASELYLNDGNGYFTDATAGSGFVVDVTPYQSKMEDLDNDGFVDIIISGDNSRVFRNNHDHTFTLVSGLFDNNNMLSFATGDLNHDGKIDLYSTYGTVYNNPTSTNDVLWLNTTNNGNHFITFNLQGTVSNRDALGARVEIYGAWGKQIREVRAGESYGTTNSFMCHFGLGTATTVDSVIVRWPSHLVTTLYNRPADQFITIIEGQCSSPDNLIAFNGPAVLCAGQSVTMTAPAGYAYLWSTGDTTQSVSTSVLGDFTVRVKDNASGCSSISRLYTVLSQPDETPTISAAGATIFCEGSSVVLQGTPANAYLWSNGDTTQNTTVTQAGSYSLTIHGTCADFTSTPIVVSPISSHVTSVTPAAVCDGGALTLASVTSGSAYWFDSLTGGAQIAAGNTYTTPVLSGSVTYYVESHDSLLGLSGYVGPADSSIGAGNNYNTNQYQIFDVFKASVLKTVKVFSGAAGNRTIELRNSAGTVLQSATVNIPNGASVVTLNFNLTPGTNYRLGIVGSNFNLYRNSAGANYPYTIPNLISITGNSANDPARWYLFYNWQVQEAPIACASTRTPVTATVNPSPVVSLTGLNTQYYASDATVTLTGTPAGGTFSGTGVTGTTFDPTTAGVGGPYTVTYQYTDSNTCSGSTTAQVTVVADTVSTGVTNIQGISNVTVFPNPNNGVFELSLRSSESKKIDVAVTNTLGQKVFEEGGIQVSGTLSKQIALENAAKGIYQLVITSGKKQNAYKVVIQ